MVTNIQKIQYFIKLEQLILALGMGMLAYRVYVLEERVHELRILLRESVRQIPNEPQTKTMKEEKLVEIVEETDSSDDDEDEIVLEQQPASPPREAVRSRFVTTRQESVSDGAE